MRKLAILAAAAGMIGTLGLAAPASAAPAQCYDAYGRPIGPRYDTRYPDYGWINQVYAYGGRCVQIGAPVQPGLGLYFRFGDDRRGYHDDRRRGRDYRHDRRDRRGDYDRRRQRDADRPPNAPQQRYEISR